MYLRVFADITVEAQKDLFFVDVVGMLKGTSLLRFSEKTSVLFSCFVFAFVVFVVVFLGKGWGGGWGGGVWGGGSFVIVISDMICLFQLLFSAAGCFYQTIITHYE